MRSTLAPTFAFVLPFLISALNAEESAAGSPAIVELKKLKTESLVFKDASRTKPVVLKTEEAAAKYFSKGELAKLKKAANFKKQIVLIFAWKGSGQDKMEFSVAESFPEQVFFSYKPGRTRDLRPHVKVYALRSNVKWSGPKK